jgi:glutaredoxin
MTNTNYASVVLYTTPTCPDCHALKRWLTEKGVPFEERDLSDPAIAEEAKARTGVRVAPIAIVDGEVFYGTFAQQKPRLAQALSLDA